jgi:4-hydroxybenzoate polyprenyltransferase
MRPYQWVKNVFVFAALVFAKRLGDLEAVTLTLCAFGAFCALASAVYLGNDLADRERDRAHPEKRHRPIASGAVSAGLASVGMAVLVALGIGLSAIVAWSHPWFAICPVAYIANNLLYTLRLKHVVLLDAFSIAAGFVLRVYAGGVAIGAPISEWLLLCTLFVSLFLGFCKRRAELSLLGESSHGHRAALAEYSELFLDQMIGLLGACTILAYAMYTVDVHTKQHVARGLHWTVPFVIYGVCRYLYLVHRRAAGGNPTKAMLKDGWFLANGLAWTALVVWTIYRHGAGS